MIIQARIAGRIIPVTVTPNETDSRLTISFPFFRPMIEEVKAMESPNWDDVNKQWTVAYTERNLYALNMLEQRTDPVYDVPSGPSDALLASNKDTLFKHQLDGCWEIIVRKRLILAHEMGLGKTRTIIEAMKLIGGYWWIVCPKAVKITWRAEMRKWGLNWPEDTPSEGRKNCFLLMHYERFTELVTKLQLPDNLVLDEAHKVRNPQTQRTQAVYIVSTKIRKNNGHIILATGTAQPKDPSDWWSYGEILQPGYFRESTKNKFAYRLGEYQTNVNQAGIEYRTLKHWKTDELNLLPKRIGNMAHIRLKKDCLADLPEKIYIEEQLDAAPKIAKQIQLILKLSKTGVQSLISLRQLSDGFLYDQSATSFVSPKEERLREILSEFPKNRIVIYAAFHKSIDKIKQILKEEEWEVIKNDGRGLETERGEQWLNVFQSPDKFTERIAYLGHPESGGIGLNLQASDTIIFYSNDFKGDARRQAEDRIHRIGSRGATIIDLLWLPSDRYVLQNLKKKKDLELAALGELKDYIDSELKEKWK